VAGVGIAGGAVAVNATVALGFNRVKNITAINGASVETAGNIEVSGRLSGNTTVVTTSIVGGAVAVGATVALAQIKSENHASIDTTGVIVKAANITVKAGDIGAVNSSEAAVTIVTGTVGAVAVALNFAIALNQAKNVAEITGTRGGEASGVYNLDASGLVEIGAKGEAHAFAIAANASAGLVAASVSFALAIIQSTQQALLTGTAKIRAAQLSVWSAHNTETFVPKLFSLLSGYDRNGDGEYIGENGNVIHESDADFEQKRVEKRTDFTATGAATAVIISAAAGYYTITANSVIAIADATSCAKVSVSDLTITGAGGASVANTADSSAIAKTLNLAFGGFSVGVMVGVAYASGTFEAIFESNGTADLGSAPLTVTNTYVSDAIAEILTASAGILLNVGVNTANAVANSVANTGLSGTGSIRAGAIVIRADGTVTASAGVSAPSILKKVPSLSFISVAANSAYAEVSAEQNTYVRNVTIDAASLLARSIFNYTVDDITPANNGIKADTGAIANVGGSGRGESGVSVKLVGVELNLANAVLEAKNELILSGSNITLTGDLTVENYSGASAAAGVYQNAGAGFVGIGLVQVSANTAGSFIARVNAANSKKVKARGIAVQTTYRSVATAKSAQATNGVSANAFALNSNVATSVVGSQAEASVTGGGEVETEDDLSVQAFGTAKAWSGFEELAVAISGGAAAINCLYATLSGMQKAFVSGVKATVGGDMTVLSEFNKSGADGAFAVLSGGMQGGGSSIDNIKVEISGLTVSGNVAVATSDFTVQALLENADADVTGDLLVRVDATSIATAKLADDTLKLNGLSVGLNFMFAWAKGIYEANIATASGKTVEAGTVSVATIYTTSALAQTGQLSGGLGDLLSANLSYLSVNANLGRALSATTAVAAITGAGTVRTTQSPATGSALNVTATGLADAKAENLAASINLSYIKIGLVVMSAEVSVQQSAYVSAGSVSCASAQVVSSLNEGWTGKGANAYIGSALNADKSGFDSLNLSVYGGSVNTATATFGGSNTAYIANAAIGSSSARAASVVVKAVGTAIAVADVAQGNTIGLANIGANVLYAYANGAYTAKVENSAIYAKALTVETDYTANATANTTQGTFGLKGAALDANVAWAETTTAGYACISGGSVDIDSSGKLTVKVTSNATAVSSFTTPKISLSGISLAFNLLTARLNGTAQAYISGSSVKAAGGADVLVFYNNDATKPGAAVYMNSYSTLASCSLISGSGHVLSATDTSSASAYVSNTSFAQGTGAVAVDTRGNSYAVVDKGGSYVNFNIVAFGVLVASATADGRFSAYMTLQDGNEVHASSLYVGATYAIRAKAIAGQPSLGTNISLLDVDYNQAIAKAGDDKSATLNGDAHIAAAGTTLIDIAGDVQILLDGKTEALARIDAASISVSGVDLGVNIVDAYAYAKQKAYVSGVSALLTGGDLTVDATLNPYAAGGHMAYAVTGASYGVNLAFVSGGANSVNAYAGTANEAYIHASGITSAGNLGVTATTNAIVKAEVLDDSLASLAGIKLAATRATSGCADTVKAYISGSGTDITAYDVLVQATSNAGVQSNVMPPQVSVSLVGGTSVNGTADISNEVTRAYIDTGATVRANNCLSVDAAQSVWAKVVCAYAQSYSAIQLGGYSLTAKVTGADALAYINGTAEAEDSVTLSASSSVTEVSVSYEALAASLFSGSANSMAEAKVLSQKAYANVGAGAKISARMGDVNISSRTVSNVSSAINSTNYSGLTTGGQISAYSYVNRDTRVNVGDGALIESRYGSVYIEALADYATVSSRSRDDNGSLLSIGSGPVATSNIDSTVYVVVGSATIKAIFGDLTIIADSYSNISALAYRNMKTFAGDNTSKAYITATETVKVLLGANLAGVNSANKAFIDALNTLVRAYITDQTLYSYAYSYTIAAGSKTESFSILSAYDDIDVLVGNAYVGGIDTLTVEAKHIKLDAHAESYSIINAGVTGKVYATSTINGYSYVDVIVRGNAELAGEKLNIAAYAPTFDTGTVFKDATAVANTVISWITRTIKKVSEWIEKKVSKIPFIGWLIKKIVHTVVEWITEVIKIITYSDSESYTTGSLDSQGDLVAGVYIAPGAKVHLGGAAAGMQIEVLEDGTVMAAGLDNDYDGNLDAFYTIENGKILLGPIYNNDAGTLTITVRNGSFNTASAFTAYWNTYLANIEINNFSDLSMVFDEFRVTNPAAIAPDVYASANNNYQPVLTYADEIPVITIHSAGGGNIVFTKTVENTRGSMTIVMTGEVPGDIYAVHDAQGSAIRVNRFTVTGAGNIGKSPTDKLIVEFYNASAKPAQYGADGRIVRMGEAARASLMDVEAGGTIYISICLVVDIGEIDLTGTTISAYVAALNLPTPKLTVEKVRAGGQVYIEQKQTRIRYTDVSRITGADVESISFPNGSMSFVASFPAVAPGTPASLVQLEGTDYWYSPESGLISVDAENFAFYASTLGTAHVSDDYTTYQLPNNVTVTILNATGKIVSVSRVSSAGGEDEVYQLSDFTIAYDANGNLVLTLPSTAENETGTSVTIDKDTGEMTMKIASNGAVVYLRRAASSLGWELPNGIIVYFKSAFVQSGKIVDVTWIGKNGSNDLYVLEDLNDAARNTFHVVELASGSTGSSFVAGYLYTRTQLTDLISGAAISYYNNIDEAIAAIEAAVSGLSLSSLGLTFEKQYVEDDEGNPTTEIDIAATYGSLGSANADAVTAALSALLANVAAGLTNNITVTLGGFDLNIRVSNNGANFTVTKLSVDYSVSDSQLPEGSAATAGSAVKTGSGSGTLYSYTNDYGAGDELKQQGADAAMTDYGYRHTGTEGTLESISVIRSYETVSGEQTAVYELRTAKKSGELAFVSSRENKDAGGSVVSVTSYYTCSLAGFDGVVFAITVNVASADSGTLQAFRLTQGASGETAATADGSGNYTISSMNGGYVIVNGNYRFIDDASDISDASAILYLTQDAVAVYPDGKIGLVAVEGGTVEINPDTGEREYIAAKIAIAPTLTQKKDADGKYVYSVIKNYYNKSNAAQKMTYEQYLAWVAADTAAAAAYQAAMNARAAELEAAVAAEKARLGQMGLFMSSWDEAIFRASYNGYTTQLPAEVTYQVPAWFRSGNYSIEYDAVNGLPVYTVYKDYPDSELDYYKVDYYGSFEQILALARLSGSGYTLNSHLTQAQYDALPYTLKSLFTPVYKSVYNYIDGTVIISPDADSLGAYVTYISGANVPAFDMPTDEFGRGILDKNTRIVAVKDDATGKYTGLKLIFLDADGEAAAEYDGTSFRLCEGRLVLLRARPDQRGKQSARFL
jgi:hypothetical protein